MEEEKLLKLAVRSGEMLMKYGAETDRVEDTMHHILETKKLKIKESFVTTTGIIASIETLDNRIITLSKRVYSINNNLEKVSLVNSLSRKFVKNEIDIDEAISEIHYIDNLKPYKFIYRFFAIMCTCFSFTIFFGGTILDGIGSMFSGAILSIISEYMKKKGYSKIILNLFGGLVIGFSALIFLKIEPEINFELVISGAIMPLVPGVMLTNAIRDIVGGNLISGTNRIITAIMMALEIAAGVGIAIAIIS